MGGVVSKVTDDILGFDPNGGGIYSVANDVLGSTIADDILGLDPSGGGIVPVVNTAANAAVSYALGDVAGGLLGGESTILNTLSGAGETAAAADAAFIAADAAQLAGQGLGEAQIASTLTASGVAADAASLAASMASNGVTESVMSQQLDNLSTNTGLFSQSSDAGAMADFAQTDATQLAQQTGNNVASIEQNLIAAGYDPLDAATLAQNAVLESGALSITPTQGMWDELTGYLQRNPDVLSILGKAGALGVAANVAPTQTAAPLPAFRPENTAASYTPDYFNKVQEYYTGYMPNMPRDVATPLQQWYSQGYTGPDQYTQQAFANLQQTSGG